MLIRSKHPTLALPPSVVHLTAVRNLLNGQPTTKKSEGKNEPEAVGHFSSSMDALSIPGGGVGRLPSSQRLLQAESISLFAEAVHLVLSRWTALRLAVHNEWGGGNSRQKSDQLVRDLVSWFVSSNAPIHIDELEMILDEKMVLCFNAEIEDGSVEEVAEQLMIIHEDCLEGNYDSVSKLRNPCEESQQISQSELIDRNADGSSDEEYEPALDEELYPLQDEPDDVSRWSVISAR